MFCIVDKNEIVFGPTSWSNHSFQVMLQELYNNNVELPSELTTPMVISPDVKILPVNYTFPSYNEKIQQLVGPFHQISENEVIGTYEVGDKSIEAVQNELIDKCATLRWEREIQGLTLTIQGKSVFIITNRGERDMYLQAHQWMGDTINWKFADEWLTLTKLEMQTIVDAIFNHIQTLFEWEQTKQTEIKNALTLSVLDNIVLS